MSAEIAAQLINLLTVFLIAAAVGIFVAKVGRIPYTIALLVAGAGASLVPGIHIGIELTQEIILFVVLPPLLFEGAATTDLDEFRHYLPAVATLATVGLGISIVIVAAVTSYSSVAPFPPVLPDFGFDRGGASALLVALLFGTIVLPTDPVSVLAVFDKVGAPERLAVLVEGESLINDGVAVVLFTAFLAMIRAGEDPTDLLEIGSFLGLVADIAIKSLGGAVVGGGMGLTVYYVMRNLDEHMTEIVLTVVLAYGAFLIAEHYFHFSGVIATVVAGLFIGNRGRKYAMSPRTKTAVFNTWDTAAFVVNAFIFVLLGAKTPVTDIVANVHLLVPAIVLVLVARAAAVYPIAAITTRLTTPDVSLDYQHVLLWGGLHGSIPIALVLGVPVGEGGLPAETVQTLRVLVFGVAAFSLVVQGLTMKRLIDSLGIATEGEEHRLYDVLVARARAVDQALEEAERLYEKNAIRTDVYERFEVEYGKEKEELREAIGTLVSRYPDLQRQELLNGERQVLTREESAIRDSELEGQVSSDIASDLFEEVREKKEWVDDGQTTVTAGEDQEGYEEYWRERVREFGLYDDETESDG